MWSKLIQIASDRSTALSTASNVDTRLFWAVLRQIGNWRMSKHARVQDYDPDIISDNFAKTASDPNYEQEAVMCVTKQSTGKTTVSGYYALRKGRLELMLARISRTFPGIDDIPYWV